MNESESRDQAAAALKALATAVMRRDCFDSEDRDRVRKEIEMFGHEDPELRALEIMLPERERVLRDLDERYNIATHFPSLLEWFAAKNLDYQDLIDAKRDEERIRRAAQGNN